MNAPPAADLSACRRFGTREEPNVKAQLSAEVVAEARDDDIVWVDGIPHFPTHPRSARDDLHHDSAASTVS
jgi:hypothetical protein